MYVGEKIKCIVSSLELELGSSVTPADAMVAICKPDSFVKVGVEPQWLSKSEIRK
jgi:hypothetical protein